MPNKSRLLLAALAAVVACGGESTAPPLTSALRVVNGTSATVDVLLDGQVLLRGVQVAEISPRLAIAPGAHELRLQNASGASTLALESVAGATTVAAAVPFNGTSVQAKALVDTGTIVPAGKSKLKVIHLAAGAGSIEIWRTQPDFPTPVHIMTPFAYQAQSPYLQSDAGPWEVFVTRPGSTVKLATTGVITVPAGERRTAVLLDSAGVLRFRVLEN